MLKLGEETILVSWQQTEKWWVKTGKASLGYRSDLTPKEQIEETAYAVAWPRAFILNLFTLCFGERVPFSVSHDLLHVDLPDFCELLQGINFQSEFLCESGIIHFIARLLARKNNIASLISCSCFKELSAQVLSLILSLNFNPLLLHFRR